MESPQKPTSEFSPPSARTTLEPWVPVSLPDKDAVRAQLELLLLHPLFFQSKRYPALLRFVVEQTLDGNSEQVKERSIGMEVFGRPPGYDANADPVVRVTAGEIRKRLAQYYYDPAHSEELRIELPVGSYVPVFQRLVESAPSPPNVPAPGPSLETWDQQPVPTQPAVTDPPPSRYAVPAHPAGHPFLTVLLVAITLLLGLVTGYWYHQYRQNHTPPPLSPTQTVDDFWRPLTAGPATVTICLGEPARDSSQDTDPAQIIHHPKLAEPLYFRLRQSGLFAVADVVTLSRIAPVLSRQHKAFRVSAASEASFSQLREGPAVLIGAFDNLWTMRLTRDLRFGFESVDGNALIVDRKSNTSTTWTFAWTIPYEKLAADYAIVARYRDSLTGQPVVIASGISEEGTEAAGELISNPTDLENLLRNAPPDWRNKNIEAVIETQVIDGHAGPPQLRAVEIW